jgi:hypothetical protein
MRALYLRVVRIYGCSMNSIINPNRLPGSSTWYNCCWQENQQEAVVCFPFLLTWILLLSRYRSYDQVASTGAKNRDVGKCSSGRPNWERTRAGTRDVRVLFAHGRAVSHDSAPNKRWRDIWRHTAERSHSSAKLVKRVLLHQKISTHIWKSTVHRQVDRRQEIKNIIRIIYGASHRIWRLGLRNTQT